MKKQTEPFSFNPPSNLAQEGKWLLGVTSLECTNSVFNITNGNNSFSISIPGHWNSEDSELITTELNKLLDYKSEDSIELHVGEVRKRGDQIKIGYNEYLELFDLDNREDSIIKEMKRVKYRDFEDLVFRLQSTYHEIVDTLDVKYIAGSTTGYTLAPGIYKIVDDNFMLKSLLPKEAKIKITVDDLRLKSNLTTNETIKFTDRSFFHVFLGFTQSPSRELADIPSFIQLIPGRYKSDKPINITDIDKTQLKCDCIQRSIENGVREQILYSFALSLKPGHKTYKEPRIKLFKEVKKLYYLISRFI